MVPFLEHPVDRLHIYRKITRKLYLHLPL